MNRLGTSALAALALVVAAGCGGSDSGSATSVVSSGVEAATGDPVAGKQVFDDAGCRGCHTIEGEGGSEGPNLDEHEVTYPEIVEQVTNGGGGMPSFADQLSEQEIRDVAAYVDEHSP